MRQRNQQLNGRVAASGVREVKRIKTFVTIFQLDTLNTNGIIPSKSAENVKRCNPTCKIGTTPNTSRRT